ncbi:MAG: DNA replication/repair protein RecF [Clostridia bacterium]|nr:DNA replication/repair protein RecF [Clostridia bacterium]
MNISALRLSNYRNFADESIQLHPSVNIIAGNNAMGKTNLIESVFYLSALRPIRPVRDRELIRRGCVAARIDATLETVERPQTLSVTIPLDSRKKIVKNGVSQKKAADFIGTARTVLFAPDDLNLIKDAAIKRRRMVDIALSQLRPNYLMHLVEYNRVIEQKGKLLKSLDEKPSYAAMLPAYNEKIAFHGAHLIHYRRAYLEKLARYAAANAQAISGGRDQMSLSYKTLSNIEDPATDVDTLANLIRAHCESHYYAEIAAKSCLSGPHKDDFLVDINGASARSFASQGQIRTAVLSLKLAERDIAQRDTGEYPILLLDDVLSELDGDRQNFVLNKIGRGQVIISSCTIDRYAEMLAGRLFTIENGKVTETREME